MRKYRISFSTTNHKALPHAAIFRCDGLRYSHRGTTRDVAGYRRSIGRRASHRVAGSLLRCSARDGEILPAMSRDASSNMLEISLAMR